MNQQLIDYIKKMREAGYGDDGIKGLLLNAGHKEDDIRAAFDAADGKISSQSENIVPSPPHSSGYQSISMVSENKSSLQIKSNLWAGVTIGANLCIVSVVYMLFYYALNFFLQNGIYTAYLEAANPVLRVVVIIFAIWLGVKSVTKVTQIDQKNFLLVSLYSLSIPFLFVVATSIFAATYNIGQASWLFTIINYLFSGLFLIVLTYYFLSMSRKAKYIVIIFSLVISVLAIFQGYTNYKQIITMSQAGQPVNAAEQMAEARDQLRIGDIRTTQVFLEIYSVKCGRYPGGIDIAGVCNATNPSDWASLTKTFSMIDTGGRSLPQPRTTDYPYCYSSVNANGLSYAVGAVLERNNAVLKDNADISKLNLSSGNYKDCFGKPFVYWESSY